MAVRVSDEEFDECVEAALDEIPDELLDLIDNCVVLVVDEPPAGGPELLGLYEGVPLTERGHDYAGVLPDQIFIYRRPLQQLAQTHEELVDEIALTVVHEVAHHFGIDDERLHALGYA